MLLILYNWKQTLFVNFTIVRFDTTLSEIVYNENKVAVFLNIFSTYNAPLLQRVYPIMMFYL